MDLIVRPAHADDAPRIVRIYVDSWNAGFGSLMPVITVDSARVERWRNELSGGRTRWWVAELDEFLAGFVGIGPSRDPIDPTLGELDTIAVDPAYWRSGVGTALMRTALEGIVEAGFTEGILWTLSGYDRGQRFYEAMGWRRDGGIRDNGHQISFRNSLGRPQRPRVGPTEPSADQTTSVPPGPPPTYPPL
ncbi:GNAT family N-acetyltransferase [Actinopolymorpha alba]|uniref:GNAT family N-acetyltransferase n=1 Tax=Actinopolymorpha alba TaxID=533267 RepID=UPI0012F66311|nr:GNAT family N-acetyltransferase [Actinopolymorpha alba]